MLEKSIQPYPEYSIQIPDHFVGIFEQMQENINRMKPFWEQAALAQKRTNEALAPLTRSLEAIRLITSPLSESFTAIQKISQLMSFSFVLPTLHETYTYVPPLRQIYPVETTVEVIEPTHKEIEVKVTSKITPLIKLSMIINWGIDLELRFKDSQTLSVVYKGKLLGSYTFIELGFDRKNTRETERKPDKQWDLLRQLSIIAETGYTFKTTPGELAMHLKISKAACYKLKASLTDKLQSAFGVLDDPFQEYNPEIGYRFKFALRPEPFLREDAELHASGSRYIDEMTGEEPDFES